MAIFFWLIEIDSNQINRFLLMFETALFSILSKFQKISIVNVTLHLNLGYGLNHILFVSQYISKIPGKFIVFFVQLCLKANANRVVIRIGGCYLHELMKIRKYEGATMDALNCILNYNIDLSGKANKPNWNVEIG